jgi:uncharacterized protein YoxC
MVTDSSDGTDVTVSVPPPLEEWLDERTVSLGVDREELVVQVVSAYRAAAELDDDAGPVAGEVDDDRLEAAVSRQLRDQETDLAAVDDRLDAMEDEIEEDLESLRNRVLQLRDAVRNRAKTDHTHEEFARLGDRLDAVATDVADLGDSVSDVNTELADARNKLNSLASYVLDQEGDGGAGASERRRSLDQLRATANRRGVTDATCHDCGNSVSIPLLSEPSCPHCATEIGDVTTTGFIRTRGLLIGPDPDADTDDGDEMASTDDGGPDE